MAVIDGELRQVCKVCGVPHKFDFHVPDDIWLAVVPLGLNGRVVCLDCFDDFAAKKHINYADHLKTLWFAGDRGSFEFQVVSAVNV